MQTGSAALTLNVNKTILWCIESHIASIRKPRVSTVTINDNLQINNYLLNYSKLFYFYLFFKVCDILLVFRTDQVIYVII